MSGKAFVKFEKGGDILPLGNVVTVAPFVEAGTLRDCPRRPLKLPKSFFELELQKRVDGIIIVFPHIEKRLRAKRRRLWRKQAALFTLFIAAVATCL